MKRSFRYRLLFMLILLAAVTILSNQGFSNGALARSLYQLATPFSDPIDLPALDSAITTMTFSPDGAWLAVGGEDGSAKLWALDTTTVIEDSFTRLAPDTTDPNGNTVLAQCDGEFPAASAKVAVSQRADSSTVTITVERARPNTLFTTWLRLRAKSPDSDAASFGGSPITDAGSTPLAPTTAMADLVAAAEGPGVIDVANGFWTDEEGNGILQVTLDFPFVDGAYPFHKYDPALPPVAIVGAPFAPFMLRLVSHCIDDLGHGVNAANREPWFDWSP